MREETNRVALALSAWRERESRLEKLFPDILSSNRPFLKDKLDYLDGIQAKFSRSSNEEERLTLNVLKQQRETLAKAVYTNLLARLLHYILLPFRQKEMEQINLQRSAANLQTLKDIIQKTGFGQVTQQLEQQVSMGVNSFSIPVSYYVDEKERLDYNLTFNKDNAGSYHLEGYQATLNTANKQAEDRQHNFRLSDGIIPTAEQAHHLLAGRAVNFKGQQWIQLDLNDKDTSGNFKTKLFPDAFGYDPAKVIEQLPVKNISDETKRQLLDALKGGARTEVLLQQGNREMKIYIEANPQHKTVNVFDEQHKKVTLASVLNQLNDGRPQQGRAIEFRQVLAKGKKNSHSI